MSNFYEWNWHFVNEQAARELSRDRGLTGETRRILMFLSNNMEEGNRIQWTVADIAGEMAIAKSSVSRAIRVLLDKHILLADGKHRWGWRLNPVLEFKGDPDKWLAKFQGRIVLKDLAPNVALAAWDLNLDEVDQESAT